MTKKITNKRIAELSATLEPIEEPLTEDMYDEAWGEGEDFISYNSPYFFNGAFQKVDFDGVEDVCIVQSVGEFQVLRFVAVDAYIDGQYMLDYWTNQREHEDEDDWIDDEVYLDDGLEIKGITEYKQIWIDRQGKIKVINLPTNGRDFGFLHNIDTFVNVKSLADFAYEPKIKSAILANVNEHTDFCYTNRVEPTLDFLLSHTAEYLKNNEPQFYNDIIWHGLFDKAEGYFRSFKVAHRHGYAFPTEYEDIRDWLDYFRLLGMKDERMLTNPQYICDMSHYAGLVAEEDELRKKEEAKREQERKRKEKELMAKEQKDFKEQHSWLFGIEFDSENFHFKSLDSVEAYKTEGEIMHHCIYNHKYYNKPYFLAMHITDHEGNRVATCTVDLLRREIDQIQPMCDDTGYLHNTGIVWQTTSDYKEIWNVLNARMHTFPKKEEKRNKNKQLKVA